MDVSITVTGGSSRTEAWSLYQWLAGEPDLRGRVRLDPAAPPPGALGWVGDVLVVSLGSGGVGTALVSVLIAWIRRRTGNLTIKISRPDGSSVEIHAEHVRGLDSDGVRDLVDGQTRLLSGPSAGATIRQRPAADD